MVGTVGGAGTLLACVDAEKIGVPSATLKNLLPVVGVRILCAVLIKNWRSQLALSHVLEQATKKEFHQFPCPWFSSMMEEVQ